MPYSDQIIGIYKIVNKVNGCAYVGQSQNVKKRIAEHFRLLRSSKHNNPRLQNAFNKYGEDCFYWSLEAVCESVDDLDLIENAFLSGDAVFNEPLFYNIANFSKAPMRGKKHSEETCKKIRAGRRMAKFDWKSDEYRKSTSERLTAYYLSKPEYLKKVICVLKNSHLSYSQRAKMVGSDTSTVRKMVLKYAPLKEKLMKEYPEWA